MSSAFGLAEGWPTAPSRGSTPSGWRSQQPAAQFIQPGKLGANADEQIGPVRHDVGYAPLHQRDHLAGVVNGPGVQVFVSRSNSPDQPVREMRAFTLTPSTSSRSMSPIENVMIAAVFSLGLTRRASMSPS